MCEAVKELKNFGARKVVAFATHGLFSGSAIERISNSPVDKIITTNSIPKRPNEEKTDKIIRLSVGYFVMFNILFGFFFFLGPLLAETIRRIQENESISHLFKTHK